MMFGGVEERDLVKWVNTVVTEDHKIKKLKDKSLKNSMAFL